MDDLADASGQHREKKQKKGDGFIFLKINLRTIWPTSPPNGCGEGKLFKAR